MVAYQSAKGANILVVSSDPSNPLEGQIWYNTTSNTLKVYQYYATNAWASGGNLNTTRRNASGAGTQTAGLAYGGYTGAAPSGATEKYNGTSWTSNPSSMNTGRYNMGSAGTQTAALGFGGENGNYIANTESFDGSSWTSKNSMATARIAQGFGTNTAAVAAGGGLQISPPFATTAVESWGGTNWTTVTSLNTSRAQAAGAGIQTAGLVFGGDNDPGLRNQTESYNGSSWTSLNNMNTARSDLGGLGTQSLALSFGGRTPTITGATELWNGTSWTTNPSNMGTARAGVASNIGTQTSGLTAGGATPTISNATEAWSGTVLTTRTITAS